MSEKKKKLLILCLCIFVVLGFVVCVLVGNRFYQHEKAQNQKIAELDTRIGYLSVKLSIYEGTETIEWSDEGYNYLAIGNSITIHGFASYWWDNDRGMAASKDEADYVHIVKNYLEEAHGNVTSNAVNFSTFETQAADREEFLPIIDPYLSEELNLITVQLGENVSDLTTWEYDFGYLLSYIKEKAPSAKIIVVGDFWSNGERDAQKKSASESQNVIFVSLDGIRDNKEYQSSIGEQVEDNEGNIHSIDHTGVAGHPGDAGMLAIAERIIEALEK